MSNLSDLISSNNSDSKIESDQNYTQSAFKNHIINGDFSVWQRYAATNSYSFDNNCFGPDRIWFQMHGGGDLGLAERITLNPADSEFCGGCLYSMRVTKLDDSAVTNFSTTPNIVQRLESPERYLGKTLSFSYYAKASNNLVADIGHSYIKTDNEDANYYGTSGRDVDLTTEWQRFTYTETVVLKEGSLEFGTDAYFQNYIHCDDRAQGEWIEVTGWQVEISDECSAFEHLPLGMTLKRCQRYYEKSYELDHNPGTITNSGKTWIMLASNTSNASIANNTFNTTKRVVPFIEVYSPETGNVGKLYNQTAGEDRNGYPAREGQNGFEVKYNDVTAVDQSYIEYQWTADAEI